MSHDGEDEINVSQNVAQTQEQQQAQGTIPVVPVVPVVVIPGSEQEQNGPVINQG
jgi:hypothetical protein